MKFITVKLDIQPEIFNATREFMDEKGLEIEQELSQSVSKLYAKHVPAAVRKYIEKTSPADAPAASSPSAVPISTLESDGNTPEKSMSNGSF